MYIPQLSIASSILERLNAMFIVEKSELEIPLDKTQMFSEQARLQTYKNWPHINYKCDFHYLIIFSDVFV